MSQRETEEGGGGLPGEEVGVGAGGRGKGFPEVVSLLVRWCLLSLVLRSSASSAITSHMG